MPNQRDIWRNEQSPPSKPSKIFQGSQTATLLFGTLFFFDSFREYPLSNFRGYSRKLLNYVGKICKYSPFKPKFYKKHREISAPVGKWCSIRAPPLRNLKPATPTQIFGGVTVLKIGGVKIFLKNFWNHQVSLGVSLLGLLIERVMEGRWTHGCV